MKPDELEAVRRTDLSQRSGVTVAIFRVREAARRGFRRAKEFWSWHYRPSRELLRQLRAENWSEARRVALELGAEAEKRQTKRVMMDVAFHLLKLGAYARSFQLRANAKRSVDIPEWEGSELAGRTIFIEETGIGLAVFLFFAPLLDVASRQAKRCIVAIDPRLIPLYRRSFPRLDLRATAEGGQARREADCVASFERLAVHFWPERPEQSAKLKPDTKLATEFRTRYQKFGYGRIVGIAWGSLSKNKEVPTLDDWSSLIAATPAAFVSLQYGNTDAAMSTFERLVRGKVFCDTSVDQLVDLDRFASQLAALDAVVTISNTTAHMASALGVPTIVVLDDRFHLMWPVNGDRCPWYTNTKLVRRARRPWGDVMATVGDMLAETLEGSLTGAKAETDVRQSLMRSD